MTNHRETLDHKIGVLHRAKDGVYDAAVDYARAYFTEENYPPSKAMSGKVILLTSSVDGLWRLMWGKDHYETLEDSVFKTEMERMLIIISTQSALDGGLCIYLVEGE